MSSSLTPRLSSLLQPQAYPHPAFAVRLVETHVSWVFLTGQFAYKIKRPVHYPFLDLRESARRAFFCAEELRLNRRFAPGLYLDICAVTLDGGVARISGRGEVIDHAVRMLQFRAGQELDRLLSHEAVTAAELVRFGCELAVLHEGLPVAGTDERWGEPQQVRAVLLRNVAESQRAAQGSGAFDALTGLGEALSSRLEALEPCIRRRRTAGRIRECHGDLHARNVVRYGERLMAFDCIEFEPEFRWIDLAADVAFLFMDLDACGFPEYGQAFLNGYLSQGGDYEACRLLRLYAADRALVRAKVSALQATGVALASGRAVAIAEYRRYVECARRILTTERPLLILTCGLSGSGKTWLAQRLAVRLRAVLVRSDVERRRIGGLSGWHPSHAALGQDLYSREASREVYERLRDCATDALAGGYPVVVDATFRRREDRARLRELAVQCGAAMQVIFCDAPREVLRRRIAARRRSGADASEADLTVLEWQEKHFEPISAEENLTVIHVDTTAADPLAEVLRQLAASGHPCRTSVSDTGLEH